MALETFTFGLLLSVIPFTLIFVGTVVVWALVDMSLRDITRSRRLLWALAVIALPLIGPVAYSCLVRRRAGFRSGLTGSCRRQWSVGTP